jgi:ubiquinol-cytochrome c reductase subunit 8
MAGALKAAIFNTYRRSKDQILYWLPPFVIAYAVMQWAIER